MNAPRSGKVALVLALAATCPTQQPAETVAVTGRAIDADGEPVAGCAVGVFPSTGGFDTKELLARPLARTDEHGRYRVTAAKDGWHVLAIATKGHQVHVQRLHTQQGDRALPDALMLPGTTLRGRVRGAGGKPIANAQVRVEDSLVANVPADAWLESRARTDASGIFEVPGVPRTGLRVTVLALGHAEHSQLAAHDSPLDVRLEPTGIVRGRVVDAGGAPVANANVSVVTVEDRRRAQQADSDADGRFELTVPRTFRFRVAAQQLAAPYRRFSSGLLRGPQDDVVVAPVEPRRDGAAIVTVRCVDAATKAALEHFHASWSMIDSRAPGSALMDHVRARRPYRGEARIDIAPQQGLENRGAIVVDAPGHGFAVVDVPADDTPLVVELPPECVLTGTVTDAVTGKPAAGVAVRALPRGTAGGPMGSGPDPWQNGAVTDAAGRYRIGGLAPRDYDVQVYHAARQASEPRTVTVSAADANMLDLEVPEPAMLELELVGDVPERCLGSVTFGGMRMFSGVRTGVNLDGPMPPLPNVPLLAGRKHVLGPVHAGEHRLMVRLPSRDRVGSALLLDLGTAERGRPASLALPDLRQTLHRGRVHLPADVPRERVAVAARRVEEPGPRRTPLRSAHDRKPFAVCLDSDGAFAIDLPPGRYALQLVDLETGIVFHTESDDHTFAADAPPAVIELRPTVRWLTIDLEPATADAPVVLQSVSIELRSPRDELPAMLRAGSARNGVETGWLPFPAGARQLRWLVPETAACVRAHQTFEILAPTANGWQAKPVDAADVPAGTTDARVTLKAPAPPDDAMLVQPAPR